jgi:hypothetical protein
MSADKIPEALSLPKAQFLMPKWNPLNAIFTLGFSFSITGVGFPTKDRALYWICSPHGETQIRHFLKSTGNIRFDLIVPMLGRVVIELNNKLIKRNQTYKVTFDFNLAKNTVLISLDDNNVGRDLIKIISGSNHKRLKIENS